MATYTPNLNLKKPDYTDLADVADFNANMDIIDGLTQDDIPDGITNKAFTATEKNKLAGIETRANRTTIVNNLTETIPGKALDATQGRVLAEQIRDISVEADTIPLSPETADLYGLTGEDATVDEALQFVSNARFIGKRSQMSGASSSSVESTILAFTTEDVDDLEAINLSSYPTRITIPANVSLVKFFAYAELNAINNSSAWVQLTLYKNGIPHKVLVRLAGGSSGKLHGSVYSLSIPVTTGDYFELHFSGMKYSSSSYPTCDNVIFGMEVLK